MREKKKKFDNLFAGIEEVKNGELINTILYSRNGNYSVIFRIKNPVEQYCADVNKYYDYTDILSNIVKTLGEGYCLQKQDIFCRQSFKHNYPPKTEFLSRSYFDFFEGRPYMSITTYLIITQELKKGVFFQYDKRLWENFHVKIQKVEDILSEKKIEYKKLTKKDIEEYIHRYMAFTFKKGPFSLNNFKASDEELKIGKKTLKCFSVVDIDEVSVPSEIRPFVDKTINGASMPMDIVAFLANIPESDCTVYNQVIMIPQQRKEMMKLIGKAKRHSSLPDPSNKIAKADIDRVLEVIANESKLLVYCNYTILTSSQNDKIQKAVNFIENSLYDSGILCSKNAYNQLELFTCSFPGNAYELNPHYDRFLCLHDAAICFMYKEHLKISESTPLKVYYTDRQGVPVAIDITGKEGKNKLTDNANFFCLGPSGSGKSFNMNTIVRQLIEQETDVVMVDTGDSYEGICGYYHGKYISYTKEHPISMNPFAISEIEYNEDFKEKKNFLKSLLILIWKGSGRDLNGVEETLLDMIIEEYYSHFFHPFDHYTEDERQNLRDRLLLESKGSEEYNTFADKLEEERKRKVEEKLEKLQALADRGEAGESMQAKKAIIRINEREIESKYLMRIERKIDAMEQQQRSMKVTSLSFNSFYEFALVRIPLVCRERQISFSLNDFKFILSKFYKGGNLDMTLNNNVDKSLFDERFIVFEIDKIKDDPILFPIVTLIIMDVFLQKMRIKKGRKALIIEEAWKAIASPTMAEYIKYLYKTVRKHNGIAGIVTQELNDVISSPIVQEAIINNSDIKILLDQSKFKDRYDEIANVLGLTEVDRRKIFSINRLDNKEGRNYFKEVYIARGLCSDVFGVEEPPECYMAYTTERQEKEALKIYLRHYVDMEQAITAFCQDMKKKGIKTYLDFARLVNKEQNIMELWEKEY